MKFSHSGIRVSLSLIAILLSLASFSKLAPKREFYELRVYHFKTEQQEQRLDNYLNDALMPALKKAGIKRVGVFKPIANDTAADKKIFVLVPFVSLNDYFSLDTKFRKDKTYIEASKDYVDAAHNNAPYTRFESILLRSFAHMPESKVPDLKSSKNERVYELRSYEGATEKLYLNKVSMFNEGGEIKLFERLGFNAVFYGEVLAGCRMPNLMYMTSFENMNERNEHWKTFGNDPEWKSLSSDKKYANNVSRGDTYLLRTAEYSDF
jgi:hypothetical protein